MKKSVYIYFYNDDNRTYNVKGPIVKDSKTTAFTIELQSYGLNLRISTTDQVNSIEEAKKLSPEGFIFNEKLSWLKD